MSPLGPAFSWEGPELFLDHPWRNRHLARLLDLPPMGVGVEAVVSQSDLAFLRNMGTNLGDELQVVHSFHLFGLFAIAVADLACPLIEGEAFQGKKGPDHVFPTRSASTFVLALTRL